MKAYANYTKFLLVWVFLVIIAGGVVRTTQSGMGCPDWPRCFGMWVPPTNASQLPADYEKYLKKQDIDHTFNAVHTWIEYINRLLGALLGIWIFIHTIWSFRRFYKNNRSIVWLSLAMLLLTGFQGWLGKKVVDANLAAVKITTHMLVALLIAALPVIILHKLRSKPQVYIKNMRWLSTTALLLLVVQIILGTTVREQIDEISRPLNYANRELWIPQLDHWFIVHRSFSWLVAISIIAMLMLAVKQRQLHRHAVLNATMVILLIIIGIVMAYNNIPALAQPAHLLVSSALVISLFAFRLRVKANN